MMVMLVYNIFCMVTVFAKQQRLIVLFMYCVANYKSRQCLRTFSKVKMSSLLNSLYKSQNDEIKSCSQVRLNLEKSFHRACTCCE